MPPNVLKMTIKKLSVPTVNNENLLVRLVIEPIEILPQNLPLKVTSDFEVNFKDDGVLPDNIKGDNIYAGYIKEDIQKFVNIIKSNRQKLLNKGSFVSYTGHTGKVVTEIPTFDEGSFNNGFEVEVSSNLVSAADCATSIKKEKSLFITDLSVVEDPARTYNLIDGTGDVDGEWTFGVLLRNIANADKRPDLTVTKDQFEKNFIKNWLKTWTDDELVNYPNGDGETIKARKDVFNHLINPWLAKCNQMNASVNNNGVNFYSIINGDITYNVEETDDSKATYWETLIDGSNADDLIKYAPFKLMAIVNRIDMRQNLSFPKYPKNGIPIYTGGETRFIFTLINLYKYGPQEIGKPPIHNNQSMLNFRGMDWKGMNVIFEFGNTSKNYCEEKHLAQEWLNLSENIYPDFPLPPITATNYNIEKIKSDNYNEALQLITDKVTAKNAKNNGATVVNNNSAINRIRTNEKIFDRFLGSTPTIASDIPWQMVKWELKQFEINDATHYLQRVGVSNVPNTNSNSAIYNDAINLAANPSPDRNLLHWVYKYKNVVKNGKHKIPYYPSGTNKVYRAGSAIIDYEFAHYWDYWNPDENTDTIKRYISNYTTTGTSDFIFDKQLRHSLSLETCQGCHTGENKTAFMQVRPRGYGQTAIYWNGVPDYETGQIDNRFIKNSGRTLNPDGQYPIVSDNYISDNIQKERYYPIVSSFLTGIAVNGTYPDPVNTIDDFVNNLDDGKDQFPYVNNILYSDNLFNVNSPINSNPASFLIQENVFGYNELEARKLDMCYLLNAPCTLYEILMTPDKSPTLSIMANLIAFPKKI
jgi:hypothetical protein